MVVALAMNGPIETYRGYGVWQSQFGLQQVGSKITRFILVTFDSTQALRDGEVS